MTISNDELRKYLAQLRRIEKHRIAGAEKEIRRIYKTLLKDLKQFLGVAYADGDLTVATLQQKGEYAHFLQEVERRINNLTPKAAMEIRRTVEDTYKSANQGMINAVQKASDSEQLSRVMQGLHGATPETIKRAIENPISGLTLSDTLERNRQAVVYNIKKQVNIGLMNGDRFSAVAKNISNELDMDYRKAVKITRTESRRAQEAGFHDTAEQISEELHKADLDLVYVKIWRTMDDGKVRPNQRRKTAKGWKTTIGNGANHQKMEGVTIRVDDLFDLGGGVTTKAPLQSGVAGQDINCRCFLEYEMMTAEEFAQKGFTNAGNGGIIKGNRDGNRDSGDSFVAASSIKDADEYAKTVLGIQNVSYKGVDLTTANEWNKGLKDSFDRFPELKKNFGFVGEAHERNVILKPVAKQYYLDGLIKLNPSTKSIDLEPYADKKVRQLMRAMQIGKDTYAQSWEPNIPAFSGLRGVSVNRDWGKKSFEFVKSLVRNVNDKFHPVGCDTIKSVLDHEIGHQLDGLLGIGDVSKVQSLFDSRTRDELTNELSKYAWNNDNKNRYSEMIAEAWAEYCNNPQPRKIATGIGEIIEAEYKKKFGKK